MAIHLPGASEDELTKGPPHLRHPRVGSDSSARIHAVMPPTTQIAGRFIYAADVVPKGNRNPRRALIHATALFDIPTADEDIERDALVVTTPREEKPVSYALHGGRLYRPAMAARGQPVSLDLYRRMLARWPELAHIKTSNATGLALHSDPIAHSYGPNDVHQWPSIRDPDDRHRDFPMFAEEDFQGRILSSDRDVARQRYERAARHVLLVGNEIHYRAIEPMWAVSSIGVQLVTPAQGFQSLNCYQPENLGRTELHRMFGLHRLDDAKAWFAKHHDAQPCLIEGKIVRPCSGYDPEPVLARSLQGTLHSMLRSIEQNRDYLGSGSYAAWGRLRQAAASIEPYDLGELGRAPDALVDDLKTIAKDLDGHFMPRLAKHYASDFSEALSQLQVRISFELGRRQILSEEDDLSLATVNRPPMPASVA